MSNQKYQPRKKARISELTIKEIHTITKGEPTLMKFLSFYEELGITKEEVVFDDVHDEIYSLIIKYFRLKRESIKGNFVDLNILQKLKDSKNDYLYHYINMLHFLYIDKSTKLYKSLRMLIRTIHDYAIFMNSNEDDSFKEYFLEYDIYIMIHIFYYIQRVNLYNPTFDTIMIHS